MKNCVITVQMSSRMTLMKKMRALNDTIVIAIISIIEPTLSMPVVNVDIQKTKSLPQSQVEITKLTNQNAFNPPEAIIDNITNNTTIISWVWAAMNCIQQEILNQTITLNIISTIARWLSKTMVRVINSFCLFFLSWLILCLVVHLLVSCFAGKCSLKNKLHGLITEMSTMLVYHNSQVKGMHRWGAYMLYNSHWIKKKTMVYNLIVFDL